MSGASASASASASAVNASTGAHDSASVPVGTSVAPVPPKGISSPVTVLLEQLNEAKNKGRNMERLLFALSELTNDLFLKLCNLPENDLDKRKEIEGFFKKINEFSTTLLDTLSKKGDKPPDLKTHLAEIIDKLFTIPSIKWSDFAELMTYEWVKQLCEENKRDLGMQIRTRIENMIQLRAQALIEKSSRVSFEHLTVLKEVIQNEIGTNYVKSSEKALLLFRMWTRVAIEVLGRGDLETALSIQAALLPYTDTKKNTENKAFLMGDVGDAWRHLDISIKLPIRSSSRQFMERSNKTSSPCQDFGLEIALLSGKFLPTNSVPRTPINSELAKLKNLLDDQDIVSEIKDPKLVVYGARIQEGNIVGGHASVSIPEGVGVDVREATGDEKALNERLNSFAKSNKGVSSKNIGSTLIIYGARIDATNRIINATGLLKIPITADVLGHVRVAQPEEELQYLQRELSRFYKLCREQGIDAVKGASPTNISENFLRIFEARIIKDGKGCKIEKIVGNSSISIPIPEGLHKYVRMGKKLSVQKFNNLKKEVDFNGVSQVFTSLILEDLSLTLEDLRFAEPKNEGANSVEGSGYYDLDLVSETNDEEVISIAGLVKQDKPHKDMAEFLASAVMRSVLPKEDRWQVASVAIASKEKKAKVVSPVLLPTASASAASAASSPLAGAPATSAAASLPLAASTSAANTISPPPTANASVTGAASSLFVFSALIPHFVKGREIIFPDKTSRPKMVGTFYQPEMRSALLPIKGSNRVLNGGTSSSEMKSDLARLCLLRMWLGDFDLHTENMCFSNDKVNRTIKPVAIDFGAAFYKLSEDFKPEALWQYFPIKVSTDGLEAFPSNHWVEFPKELRESPEVIDQCYWLANLDSLEWEKVVRSSFKVIEGKYGKEGLRKFAEHVGYDGDLEKLQGYIFEVLKKRQNVFREYAEDLRKRVLNNPATKRSNMLSKNSHALPTDLKNPVLSRIVKEKNIKVSGKIVAIDEGLQVNDEGKFIFDPNKFLGFLNSSELDLNSQEKLKKEHERLKEIAGINNIFLRNWLIENEKSLEDADKKAFNERNFLGGSDFETFKNIIMLRFISGGNADDVNKKISNLYRSMVVAEMEKEANDYKRIANDLNPQNFGIYNENIDELGELQRSINRRRELISLDRKDKDLDVRTKSSCLQVEMTMAECSSIAIFSPISKKPLGETSFPQMDDKLTKFADKFNREGETYSLVQTSPQQSPLCFTKVEQNETQQTILRYTPPPDLKRGFFGSSEEEEILLRAMAFQYVLGKHEVAYIAYVGEKHRRLAEKLAYSILALADLLHYQIKIYLGSEELTLGMLDIVGKYHVNAARKFYEEEKWVGDSQPEIALLGAQGLASPPSLGAKPGVLVPPSPGLAPAAPLVHASKADDPCRSALATSSKAAPTNRSPSCSSAAAPPFSGFSSSMSGSFLRNRSEEIEEIEGDDDTSGNSTGMKLTAAFTPRT